MANAPYARQRANAIVFTALGIIATGWFAAQLLFGGRSLVPLTGPLVDVLVALMVVAPFAAVLALRRPVVFPLVIYVVMVPFENLLHLPGGGTMPKLIAVGAAAVLGFSLLRTGRFVVPDRAVLVWTLFILWTLVAICWTLSLPEAVRNTQMLLQLYLFYVLIAMVPADERDLRILVGAMVLSGIAAAADGVIVYRQAVALHGGPLWRVELSGGAIDPNHFAAALQAPMAILIVAFLRQRRLILKAVFAAGALVVLAGIMATGSRAGLMAFGIVLAYIVWRRKAWLQLLLLTVPGVAITLSIPTVWARINDPTQGEAGGRFEIWRVALASFKQHWVFGSGTGSYHIAYQNAFLDAYQQLKFYNPLQDSHNIVIFAAVECGIIGVVLLLSAWFFQFRMLRHIGPNDRFYDLRIAIEAAMLALFEAAMTLDMMYYKYLWLLFSIAAVTRTVSLSSSANVVRRTSAARPYAPASAAVARAGEVVLRARATRADVTVEKAAPSR